MIHRPFSFGQLRPARAPGAEAINADLLGGLTLGIEVTEPELAARCGLGNLDPQHGPIPDGRAAIEAALDFPIPPLGARLVTIRPDGDAIGAMAVLSLRADACSLPAEGLDTVAEIGRADRFERGGWRDFVAAKGPLPARASAGDLGAPGRWAGILASIAADHSLSLSERVDLFRRALVLGDAPARYASAREAFARALAQAWNEGRVTVTHNPGAPIALVRGEAQGALALGYRFAPVVIAELAPVGRLDEAPRKVTIAQFEPGWVDLTAVARCLGAVEAGWGGSETILGSPQAVGTRVSLQRITEVVESALTPGAQRLQDGRGR